MSWYLIDYENIKNISGLDSLSPEDTVIFFYSENANSMSIDLHIELERTKAEKVYFLSKVGGKNALDFQMSSYIGYLISRQPEDNIYIISGDKGFLNLISFWQERGFDRLELRKNIAVDSKNEELPDALPEKPDGQEDTCPLKHLLLNHLEQLKISADQCDVICNIVETYKTKQAINNNLMKHFRDSDKAGKITKLIKPFLKSKK